MSEKKLHLALGVSDLVASVADYSRRLGAKPVVVVDGEYALWRTKTLNLSIRHTDAAVGLRHLGWEDPDAGEFSSESDCNGLVWEHFSAAQQAEEINCLWPQADYQPDARHRRIKSFVLRQGHLSKGQEKALYDFGPRFCIPYAAEPLDLDAAFGRHAPRVLEIGFGMGQATAEIAAGRPDTDFIGVEVHTPGVGSLLKLVGEGNIGNVRIIQHDAVEVLQHMLAPDALDGVHIYFPDPWHKKRHHKRRLIQPEFVQLLLSRLKPGGYIHLATDWEDYAIQMLDVLSATPQLENTADGYAPRPDYRPLTKFENRGIRLGHGVWDLVFRKK